MSQDDGTSREREQGPFGESVEAVTEQVLDSGKGGPDVDPETVRQTLEAVSEEGTVTRAALDDALAHVSKVVATPETRVEFSASTLADARETAEGDTDLAVVGERLDALENDLDALEGRIDDLSTRLSAVAKTADAIESAVGLYAIAAEIRDLRATANEAQHDADELTDEIETFEDWVADPSRRLEDLQADADSIEASLQDLLEEAEALLDATGRRHGGVGAGEEDTDESAVGDRDLPRVWAETELRRRVLGLLLEDVRAELDAVETLAERRDVAFDSDDFAQRVEDIDSFREDIGHRLDDAFDTAWADGYGEVVLDFDQAMNDKEPPIDWAEIDAEMERHRERLPGRQERKN